MLGGCLYALLAQRGTRASKSSRRRTRSRVKVINGGEGISFEG